MRLAARHRIPEMMDDPQLDEQLHRQALAGLRWVNRFSNTSRIFWPAIAALVKEHANGRPLRLLDIASGGGDVAISLALRAKRAGVPLDVSGCDVSPVAIEHARNQASQAQVDVTFSRWDVLSDPFPDGVDILTCSLFLHHLDEADAIRLMEKMAAAARLLLIDDLRRTRLGYVLAWTGCRLLSRSPIVHHDGPQSVVAAFSESEARELADRAGMREAVISRHWPQRYLLTWRRP